MAKKHSLIFPLFVFALALAASHADAQDQEQQVAVEQNIEHAADVLVPPPLPKLDKGDWTSKKSIFTDALSVEDADGNDLDKVLDLPGTTYTAHIGKKHTEETDEDPIYQFTSVYEQALAEKYFDYRVRLADSAYYVSGAAEDSSEGGVYGQSVVAQGKLRFIAVGDSGGDISIFVSDEIPVGDMLQMISAKDKNKIFGSR